MSRGDDVEGPFDSLASGAPRAPGAAEDRAFWSSSAESSHPTTLETDEWRNASRESAPQWSLLEMFVITAGSAATSGLTRFVPPVAVATVLGTVVIFGWLRLHLEDWEPRWAVITWRTVLASYLTSILVAILNG